MRFWIDNSGKWRSSYRLHVQDAIIPVRSSFSKLSWTWWDRTDYTLIAPPYSLGRSCSWHIMLEEQIVCSRRLVFPTSLKAFLRSIPPYGEWNLNGQLVFAKVGALRCLMFPQYWTLQLCNDKRLAFWRRRIAVGNKAMGVCGGFEGVWHKSLPEAFVPIVFGMILAEIYDSDTRHSGGGAD